MSTRISLKDFEEIYEKTYKNILKYIIQKCSNIDDVNDLLQDTYVAFYEYLHKKSCIEIEDCNSYLITIARKQLSKHYGLVYSIKQYFVAKDKNDKADEIIEEIDSKIDIERDCILKMDAEKVWIYIKNKDIKTIKVFYLYFYEELKIKEISNVLDLNESIVKNILYRNLREIRENFMKEGEVL